MNIFHSNTNSRTPPTQSHGLEAGDNRAPHLQQNKPPCSQAVLQCSQIMASVSAFHPVSLTGKKFSQKELDTHLRTCARIEPMPNKPLNLSLDSELIKEIKLQSVREERTVSELADEVFRDYLERQKKAKGKGPTK